MLMMVLQKILVYYFKERCYFSQCFVTTETIPLSGILKDRIVT